MGGGGIFDLMYQDRDAASAADLALIESAIDLLGAHGLGGATTRAIAERAGLSAALVNYRFGSRAGLVKATLDLCCRRDEEAWSGRAAKAAAVPLSRADLRAVLHAVLQDDFRSRRRYALVRWACLVETERSGAHREFSWRWIAGPTAFWRATLAALDLDPAMAPLISLTLFSTGLPYLFAEPSFEHDAWVHDLVDRLADRLIGVAPPRLGDSPWRAAAEKAAEDWLDRPARAGESAVRRTIIDGAVDLVMSQGVEALTHRAIAEHTGVALSSTTHHFRSLEDILIEACLEVYRRARGKALAQGVAREFSLADMMAGLPAPHASEGAPLRGEMAAIHEVMFAISRAPAVRTMAIGLLAHTGRTSTTGLAALTGRRGDVDRIDGQLFGFLMTGFFLLGLCWPQDEDRAPTAAGLAAAIRRLWM
jgi:AcrR family transcriptional regulator